MAIIAMRHISKLIPIAKILSWELSPDVKIILISGSDREAYSLIDALSEPQMLESAEYFELVP
jgi:hypothetical protein